MDLKFQSVSEYFLDDKEKHIDFAVNEINMVLSLDCVKKVQQTIFGESRMITKRDILYIHKDQLNESRSYYKYIGFHQRTKEMLFEIVYIIKNVHDDIIAKFYTSKWLNEAKVIIRSVYINNEQLIQFVYPQLDIRSRTFVLDFTKNTGGSYTHAEMYRKIFDTNIEHLPSFIRLVDRHTNHRSLLRIDYWFHNRVAICTCILYQKIHVGILETMPLELRIMLIEMLYKGEMSDFGDSVYHYNVLNEE